MAEICRVLEQPAPAPSKSEEQGKGRTKQRIRPTRMVRISGRSLVDETIDAQIVSLVVEESARGLSKAVLTIQNDRLRFTDHELLVGQSLTVEIYTGYENTRLVKRGSFLAAVPRYAFRNQAMPLIKLECYSEEWPLAVSERRATYENLSDAEIAARIAKTYQLETDIQKTSPRYEHVVQFNTTDIEFLESRALLHGFDVYVQEGVLHFHEPRFSEPELTLFYAGGESGVLSNFEVTVDPWVKGAQWVKSGIDRLTGQEYEFRSNGELDGVAGEIRARGGPGFKQGSQLSKVQGSQPKRFIVGDGHEQSEGEAKGQVAGYARASEWVVVGSGNVRGIEHMKARQTVTISGIGHLAGVYYVTHVTHRVDSNGYSMQFQVTRPGVGRLEDRMRTAAGTAERRDVTSESQSAGEAEVVGASGA